MSSDTSTDQSTKLRAAHTALQTAIQGFMTWTKAWEQNVEQQLRSKASQALQRERKPHRTLVSVCNALGLNVHQTPIMLTLQTLRDCATQPSSKTQQALTADADRVWRLLSRAWDVYRQTLLFNAKRLYFDVF